MAKTKQRRRKDRTPSRRAGRPRLSLCLIARDEAGFLERCLSSVAGLADEIVAVDTGSTDATPEVARRHGARVYQTPWDGDFSGPRNLSLDRARGEWILVLDCDEVLSPRDHDGIRAAMDSGAADAYRLTTRNYTDATEQAGFTPCQGAYPAEEKGRAGWFPTTKVRLWRRHPQVRFTGAVHELVEPSLAAQQLRLGDCGVPVHHYGYVAKERAPDRYLEAGERKVREQPQDLRARYELAIAYRDAGRLSEALGAIEAVAAGAAPPEAGGPTYLQEELVHLVHGDILDRLGRLDEAMAVYRATLARFPGSFQALNNMGSILGRRGDLAGARDCYGR
ncbi:MAG: glycosyltransferase, partial [Gemmatimonadota bacterium]